MNKSLVLMAAQRANVYNGMPPGFRVTLPLDLIVHFDGCNFVFVYKRCKLLTHTSVCLYD